MKGYYSLVQFCPDMSRLEAVNVGLLLFCPEARFIGAQTLHTNKRVTKLFKSVDEAALDAAKQSLEARLRVAKADFKSLEDLQKFVDTRANDLRLTQPRPVKVENPEQELVKLLAELVGREAVKASRVKARFPELQSLFERLSQQGRARLNVTETVPITNRELKVPYEYPNGRPNLVVPKCFKGEEDVALKSADHLATQGRLLFKYGNSGKGKQLVIVPQYDNNQLSPNGLAEKLGKLFEAHDVKFVRHLNEFMQQVESEAHP